MRGFLYLISIIFVLGSCTRKTESLVMQDASSFTREQKVIKYKDLYNKDDRHAEFDINSKNYKKKGFKKGKVCSLSLLTSQPVEDKHSMERAMYKGQIKDVYKVEQSFEIMLVFARWCTIVYGK